MNFTGWNPHDEEKDFADYSGLCQGNILEWSDVESQLVRDAANPFTMTIPEAVRKLQQARKSSYQDYTFGRQETNDCCSWGTANGIDLTQIAQALRGIETECFRSFKPWIYGVGKCLAGQRSDNGMSVSLAIKHITQYGILPEDLPGLPKYSGALQKELLRSGKTFFERWKDKAIMFDIDVVRVPLDYDAWYLVAASGRNIVYGTTQRLAKKNGEWYCNGGTNHCRTAGFPVRPSDGAMSDTNSWNDGTGFMNPKVAKQVIAKSHNYGAFCIYRIAQRNSQPDYSGLGG